jgi:hypothetical protein
MVAPANTNTARVVESFTVATSTSYVFSVYAKAGTVNFLYLFPVLFTTPSNAAGVYFDLTNGTVGLEQNNAQVVGSIEDAGNGWYRCSIHILTTDAVDTTGDIRVQMTDANGNTLCSAGGSLSLYGAQLEAGAFLTSYIPTSGATATRSADNASIATSAFGYRQTEGSFLVEAETSSTAKTNHNDLLLKSADSTKQVSSGSRVGGSAAGTYTIYAPSPGILITVSPGITGGLVYKAAYRVAPSKASLCVNGGSVATDASVTFPTKPATVLEIGDGFGYLNGHIKSIKYYPRRLTDAQLQELTT